MTDCRLLLLGVLFAGLAAGVPHRTHAQALWLKPYEPNQIGLEVLLPSIDPAEGETPSALTSASALSVSYLFNDQTTLVAEFPFAYYEASRTNAASVSDAAIGNPYVGLGISSTRAPLYLEMGVRIPVADTLNAAAMTGAWTTPTQREAFVPHQFAAQTLLNTRLALSRIFSFRLRGGPLLTVPTQDAAGRDVELFAKYSVQAWYEGERYVLGAGLTGRGLLTETGGAFSERTAHALTGTLILNLGPLQPGLLLRTPLNGPGSENVGLVAGVTLGVRF